MAALLEAHFSASRFGHRTKFSPRKCEDTWYVSIFTTFLTRKWWVLNFLSPSSELEQGWCWWVSFNPVNNGQTPGDGKAIRQRNPRLWMSSRNQAAQPTLHLPGLEHRKEIGVNLYFQALYVLAAQPVVEPIHFIQFPVPGAARKGHWVSERHPNGMDIEQQPYQCWSVTSSQNPPMFFLLMPPPCCCHQNAQSPPKPFLSPITVEVGAPGPPRRTQESRTHNHFWRNPLSCGGWCILTNGKN